MPHIVHWSFDPVALTLWRLQIHWYGICWMLAFLLGEKLVTWQLKLLGHRDVDVQTLFVRALVGTVVGARLAHCLLYEPVYYFHHPWKVLALWEGGMASHGGAAGLILAVALSSHRLTAGLSPLAMLDVVALPAAVGGALIRLANFLNSEILGNPTSGNWGVVFDQVDTVPRHPVQLYEAAAYLVTGAILLAMRRRHSIASSRGCRTGAFLFMVFSSRFALEFWKTPQAAYEAGDALSMGQWLSLPCVVIGVGLMLAAMYRPLPPRPVA